MTMSFIEVRKFNFFNLKENVDEGALTQVLNNATLTAFTSGNGQLVLCDSTGFIHLVSRKWHVNTFRGCETSISFAVQLRESPLLVIIGEDEPGSGSVVKVWDTTKLDKNDVPKCVRIMRLPVPMVTTAEQPPHATALCAQSHLLAVAMSDGGVWLRRGDLTRERGIRQRTISHNSTPITGLAFRVTSKHTYLFVVTAQSVSSYNITLRDQEQLVELDNETGCSANCCILTETLADSHLMVGNEAGVFWYTVEARGGCYCVVGKKVMLDCFRGYLVIIALVDSEHQITVLDIQNKFIIFSHSIPEVKAILNEWGAFYLIGGDNTVYRLDEKDIQSKLNVLFKKNLYDVSIRLAKSQQYDADALIDIFRKYGDHLYKKGDHAAALEQYIKTIGKLETSYVIRKFLAAEHTDKLTTYLQALHKSNQAGKDHTTLLLNCYTKLDHSDKLKEFFFGKDREVDFDVEIAIRVCRRASLEDALALAKKYAKHEWYLRIQIEDHRRYADALDYIDHLPFVDAEAFMKKYGSVLLENMPAESTTFLKKLCTDYKPADAALISENMLDGSMHTCDRCNPDDFIDFFLNKPERLVEFLEYVAAETQTCSPLVYDTLIENYLYLWKSGVDKFKIEAKLLLILQNPETGYDQDQALVLCRTHGCTAGVMYLYGEAKLYQQILQYQMRAGSGGDLPTALAYCHRYGHQDPNLWVQALWYCTRTTTAVDAAQFIIPEILDVINKNLLLSPLLVLDSLCNSPNITLGIVRSYLADVLHSEIELAQRENKNLEKDRKDTEELRKRIGRLRDEPIVFQSSRCAICKQQLDLPAIHFMCQHSYHQHCFQSHFENESECLACQKTNKPLMDRIQSRHASHNLHKEFTDQLEGANDTFSLLAEYFGRGIFNKLTVITERADPPTPFERERSDIPDIDIDFSKKVMVEVEKPNYGPGAEARLRLSEGQKQGGPFMEQTPNQRFNKPSSSIVPTSEGRMRYDEQRRYEQKYSSSLDMNKSILHDPKFSSSTSTTSKFDTSSPRRVEAAAKPDEIEYPETLNPFSPDCNKNLNPFDE